MQHFIRGEVGMVAPTTTNVRCPACRHEGAFHAVGGINDARWTNAYTDPATGQRRGIVHRAGIRKCPNRECSALLFIAGAEDDPPTFYPSEVIDFDSTNLPQTILASLEEAVLCHANGCFKASSLMVRRVLEEVCADKNVTERDLKARIAALGGTALVPPELLTAADELRILGNDAAHIEAKAYDSIGSVEAELAIELAKELLKAVYQYSSLVARLQALKRQPTT